MLPLGIPSDYEKNNGQFQWAPTLGGECYLWYVPETDPWGEPFQWAPTLGGECYKASGYRRVLSTGVRFNGHPPLGVNATETEWYRLRWTAIVSMGTHPWG